MSYFIDTDLVVVNAVAFCSSLCPLDVALGIDIACSNEDVLICVVQIESHLCSVESVILRDSLCDGDVCVLNIVLDHIHKSIIVVKGDLLCEVLAVGAQSPT